MLNTHKKHNHTILMLLLLANSKYWMLAFVVISPNHTLARAYIYAQHMGHQRFDRVITRHRCMFASIVRPIEAMFLAKRWCIKWIAYACLAPHDTAITIVIMVDKMRKQGRKLCRIIKVEMYANDNTHTDSAENQKLKTIIYWIKQQHCFPSITVNVLK